MDAGILTEFTENVSKVAPVAPMGLSVYYLYKRPSDWKVAVSTLIFSSAMMVAGLSR